MLDVAAVAALHHGHVRLLLRVLVRRPDVVIVVTDDAGLWLGILRRVHALHVLGDDIRLAHIRPMALHLRVYVWPRAVCDGALYLAAGLLRCVISGLVPVGALVQTMPRVVSVGIRLSVQNDLALVFATLRVDQEAVVLREIVSLLLDRLGARVR